MARDPRGVPDVVFKPTKYMNFVGALGKRKELEAERKMERSKQLMSNLPEAKVGDYRANFRPLAGQAMQQFTRARNNLIANADSMSPEGLAKERERLATMKMEIAGMGEDFSTLGDKLESAEKDLGEFMEENEITMSPEAYIKNNEGTDEAQNLKSILNAINVYSGSPLSKAEAAFDENGKLKFNAPGIDAKNLEQYSGYTETYKISSPSIENDIKNEKVMSIPTRKINVNGKEVSGFDEEEFENQWETLVLEYSGPKQKRSFKKYQREVQGASDQEANVMWDKMLKDYQNGKMNSTAKKYYDFMKSVAEPTVKRGYKDGGEETEGVDTASLPGSPYDVNTNVYGPGISSKEIGESGGLVIPDNLKNKLSDKAIALEEGKHKINVGEDLFVDDTGDKIDVIDSSVERVYRDDDGSYYALVKGIREKGRDLFANKLIELGDSDIASLKESLGSKVKEMGFDEYFNQVTSAEGVRQGSTSNEAGNTDPSDNDSKPIFD